MYFIPLRVPEEIADKILAEMEAKDLPEYTARLIAEIKKHKEYLEENKANYQQLLTTADNELWLDFEDELGSPPSRAEMQKILQKRLPQLLISGVNVEFNELTHWRSLSDSNDVHDKLEFLLTISVKEAKKPRLTK